jgi:CheY-like chemotaxis protein
MSNKQQVMIIEDDPDMIELLSLILKRGGYKALPALGGQAGLQQLQKTTVELILLDLMMDDMSGWTVLEKIKADKRLSDIPVLIVSARHHLEDPHETESHANQFVGYVVKPFIVQDLLTQIKEILK